MKTEKNFSAKIHFGFSISRQNYDCGPIKISFDKREYWITKFFHVSTYERAQIWTEISTKYQIVEKKPPFGVSKTHNAYPCSEIEKNYYLRTTSECTE